MQSGSSEIPFNFVNFNEYELELIREISAQIYGYEASDMWGKLTFDKPIENSPKILELYKNVHDAASPSELNNMLMQGGGFRKVLGHILNVASKVAKGVGDTSHYLSKNPYLYKNVPILGMIDPSVLGLVGAVSKPIGSALELGSKLVSPPKKHKKSNNNSRGEQPQKFDQPMDQPQVPQVNKRVLLGL